MPDKLRKTAPLDITFLEGEQPTAEKMTAVATQARNALNVVEYAVGDPWNQSGDQWMYRTPLQVPNLARSMGQSSYLNPAIYPGEDTFEFTEDLGVRYANESTGYFLWAPSDGTDSADAGLPSTYTVVQDTNSNFTLGVDSEYEVDTAGDFWVDPLTGRFRVYGELDSSDRIAYQVDPTTVSGWNVGEETLPSVIPDPNQAKFTRCRVSQDGSTYLLHLPPRQPLTLDSREKPNRYPTTAEAAASENRDSAISSPPSYWQDEVSGLTGTDSEHYRYRLPQEILDYYHLYPAGADYPAGLFQLWDHDDDTIVEGVRFKKPPSGYLDYVIEIETDDSSDSFSSHLTSDELEATYSGGSFSLIACGSPLSRSLWTLANAFYRHGHNHDGTFDNYVQHNALRGLNPPTSTHGEHTGRYSSDLPVWPASRWADDDHTSLLSRGGSFGAGHASRRDANDNAMLGELVLANANSADYMDESCADGSYGIYFGAHGGNTIYGSSDGITALASISGDYGLIVQGDTTSPVKAAFRLVPQDTQPTGAHLVGDIYVSTGGTLYICTVAGTPGTWTVVGSQT